MKELQHSKKAFRIINIVFLSFLMILAAISMIIPTAKAAGSITLTPSQAVAGSSVNVTGTGFTPNSVVGIGFGQPVQVTGEIINQIGSGNSRTAILAYHPIVPGTYVQTLVGTYQGVNLNEQEIDDGAGNLFKDYDHSSYATIDYVAGSYVHPVTVGVTDVVITATYYRYPYSVTPANGITTSVSGSFTVNITVPSVSVGNYNVTAIDASGTRATNTLNVSTQPIPEDLSIAAIILLSVAVVAGSSYLSKRSKIRNINTPIA